MRYLSFVLLLFTSFSLQAGPIDSFAQKVNASLFMDMYYSYDFNDPVFNERPSFIYNYNQHNQVSMNMALAQLSYAEKKFKLNLGVMAGTYAQANLIHEPANLQHLYEANISVALNKRRTRWLTAGLFESHLGFESVVSAYNMTLTRSLANENSPYYLSGLKYSSYGNKKLQFNALLLNGWQRMRREFNNSIPALGTQLVYQPKKSFSLNWSSYLGTEGPDSNAQVRFFHNLFANIGVGDNINVLLGFDLGLMRSNNESHDIMAWYCPTAIFEFSLPEEQTVVLRLEHYSNDVDLNLATTGMSLGYKRLFYDKLIWRCEMRLLNDYAYSFVKRDGTTTHNNAALTTSLALLID